jgi:hypothetical protein
MKVTIVPAQVTTVEDRIAGDLSVLQVGLLAVPIFGGSLLYAVLPPSMEFSLYKLMVIAFLAVAAGLLAIRIKGKVIFMWALIFLRYALRPRLYLFNKNTTLYREEYLEFLQETTTQVDAVERVFAPLQNLDIHEKAYVYAAFDDSISRLRFETTKKGGLNVRVTKVEK